MQVGKITNQTSHTELVHMLVVYCSESTLCFTWETGVAVGSIPLEMPVEWNLEYLDPSIIWMDLDILVKLICSCSLLTAHPTALGRVDPIVSCNP